MINWTEEDVEFVCKNMIMPMIGELTKELAKTDDISHDCYMRMFNAISRRIAEIDYEMIRDRKFFISLLRTQYYLTDVDETYKHWCEEYDKLNKHLLEEKNKNETIFSE